MVPQAKGEYRTSSQYEMDGRWLLLRGGDLDGRTWLGVVGVGERVFCGSGPWTPTETYVVTAQIVTDPKGRSCNVAVPAFAPA
jgi:hypothetical protein